MIKPLDFGDVLNNVLTLKQLQQGFGPRQKDDLLDGLQRFGAVSSLLGGGSSPFASVMTLRSLLGR